MCFSLHCRRRFIAAFAFAILLFTGQSALADTVISEVLWSGSDLSSSDEWVEIACTGSGSDPFCILDGWTLTSVNTSGTEVSILTFGTGTVMSSGSYAVIARLPAESSRLLSEPAFTSSMLTLPNTKLLLRLRDASGQVRDIVDDGVGDPFAGSNGKLPEPKTSMVRLDLASSGELKTNWVAAMTAQGVDSGALLLASPGFADPLSAASSSSESASSSHSDVSSSSSFASSFSSSSIEPFIESESSSTQSEQSSSSLSVHSLLWISELLPDPSGDDAAQWVEIRSDNTLALPLSHYFLRDDGTQKSLPLGSTGSVLNPGGILLLLRTALPSGLSHAGGQLSLVDRAGVVIDVLHFPGLPEAVSYGRQERLSTAEPYCVPSAGTLNSTTAPAYSVVIQSGVLSAIGPHSINFQLIAPTAASLDEVSCSFDFADGTSVDSCNPASHRFTEIGSYSVEIEVLNYCGTTVLLTQQVEVLPPISSSAESSSAVRGQSVTPEAPSVLTAQSLLLTRALPNPEGKDTADTEWIEIQNTDADIRSTQGWKMVVSDKTISLPLLTIPGNGKYLFSGRDLGITLRNTTGSVILLSPSGVQSSRLRWSNPQSGKEIIPGFDLPQGTRVLATGMIDGDTFDAVTLDGTSQKLRVRLIGIDTPELRDRNPIVRSMAQDSLNFSKALIEGKEVELNFDSQDETDPYGRILAYVSLAGGISLQEEILQSGMAWVTTGFTFAKKKAYLSIENSARESFEGIWVHPLFDSYTKEQKSGTGFIAQIGDEEEITISNIFGKIRISEAFSHPLGTGSGEWIEIVNSGTGVIDLQHWSLDDMESGGSKPWKIDRSLPIAPDHFLLFPKSVTGLALNDGGDTVRLLDPDGFLVDLVILPSLKAGLSYAFDDQVDSSDPEEQYCITTVPTPSRPNQCVSPPVKVTKIAVKKPKAASKSASASKVKMPTVSPLASLLPQMLSGTPDVVFDSPHMTASFSFMQVLIITLTAVIAGALSGAAAGGGLRMVRRCSP